MREDTQSKQYIEELFCQETPAMTHAREAAVEFDRPYMHVSALEGRLLAWLCSLGQAKTVVEVGGFTGYSALWFLSALPEDGRLYCMESDATYAESIRKRLSADPRFHLKEGDAREQLETIEGPVDLVFIDANKAGYMDYLLWAEKHLRPGGLVIGDNTFLFGAVYGGETRINVSEKQTAIMREFNQHIASSPSWDGTMIPTIEGLTVAIRK